jgi:hypothetical protein
MENIPPRKPFPPIPGGGVVRELIETDEFGSIGMPELMDCWLNDFACRLMNGLPEVRQ